MQKFIFLKSLPAICFPGLLCFLSLGGSVAYGQNPFQEELRQLYTHFDQKTQYALEVQIHVYESHTSLRKLESETGRIYRDGQRMKEVFPDYVSILGDAYHVLVNHEAQVVSVAQISRPAINKRVKENAFQAYISMIDSLVSHCQEGKVTSMDSGLRKMSISCPDFGYDSYEIFYHAGTYEIQKLVMYFAFPLAEAEGGSGKPLRMEVLYTPLSLAPMKAGGFFSGSEVFDTQTKKMMLRPAYADYDLVHTDPVPQ